MTDTNETAPLPEPEPKPWQWSPRLTNMFLAGVSEVLGFLAVWQFSLLTVGLVIGWVVFLVSNEGFKEMERDRRTRRY